MQFFKEIGIGSFASLGLLLLLFIITSAGLMASVRLPDPGSPIRETFFLVTISLLEFVYLRMVRASISGKEWKNKLTTVAVKMQFQAALTTFFSVFLPLLLIFLLDLGLDDKLIYTPSYFQFSGLILILFVLPIKFSLVWSCLVSIWRIHSLRASHVNFEEIASESYRRSEISIPASKEAVVSRMEHYLMQLSQANTPKYQRYLVESEVVIRHSHVNGGKNYEVIFGSLRWKICITISSSTGSSTELLLDFKPRAGIQYLEFFLHPVEAFSMLQYLNTYVIQLLVSDLALSNSIKTQNELRLQAAETQLRILQAQIEPHFLFNTLANIRHLYRSNIEKGEEMMNHLIRYLQSAMEDLRSDVSTVGKEIDLALHYLSIMKIRMGNRLDYSFVAPDKVTELRFPPAMLISLVENAIKHGLHSKEDGKLSISAFVERDTLRITVQDNGPGFSSVQGTGVGLSNIRQRLEALYGNKAWLEVGALHSGGFIASIYVPLSD